MNRRAFLASVAAATAVPFIKPRLHVGMDLAAGADYSTWCYWINDTELYRTNGLIVERNIGVELFDARCDVWEREVSIPRGC